MRSSSVLLQELHRERETSTGRAGGALAAKLPERTTPGCLCPAVFSPVCDSSGELVAPSSCAAACQSIPEGDYSHDWCTASSATRNRIIDSGPSIHLKHATEDDREREDPKRKAATHPGAFGSVERSHEGAVTDVGDGRFEAMLPAPSETPPMASPPADTPSPMQTPLLLPPLRLLPSPQHRLTRG